MREMLAQMSALPFGVQLWMGWMMAVFMAAAFFVRREPAARGVLGAFVLTMPVAMATFQLTGTVRMIAAAHLLVWTPLLIRLHGIRRRRVMTQPYGGMEVWLDTAAVTIAVSLILDVREVVMHFRGVH